MKEEKERSNENNIFQSKTINVKPFFTYRNMTSYRQHGLSWESAFELMNSILIHIVIASSQNIRDLRKNNLALRYGLPMPTSCKNYEKTDSAPLTG